MAGGAGCRDDPIHQNAAAFATEGRDEDAQWVGAGRVRHG